MSFLSPTGLFWAVWRKWAPHPRPRPRRRWPWWPYHGNCTYAQAVAATEAYLAEGERRHGPQFRMIQNPLIGGPDCSWEWSVMGWDIQDGDGA